MFGRKLKELRFKNDITQVEFAKLLGVAQQTVGSWEKEKSAPNYELLKQIAKYFNVSIDYLLDNDDGANANTQPPLNAEQAELIAEYDALNDEGRATLKNILYSLRLTHGKSGRSTALPNFTPSVTAPIRKVSAVAMKG